MDAVGRHILLDMRQCDGGILNHMRSIVGIIEEAAQRAGATIIGTMRHKFNPQGVSVVLGIAESHISIHTWPEMRQAKVDVFSCGQAMNPEIAALWIMANTVCRECSFADINRGAFGEMEVKIGTWDQKRINEMFDRYIDR